MAWAFVGQRGSAQNKVSGTSISMNPTANLNVGAIVAVACASDNPAGTEGATSYHTVSDSKGNTWTKIYELTRSPGGSANDGVTSSLWISKITTQVLTTDTITLTISTAVTGKAIQAQEFSVAAGNTYSYSYAFNFGTGPSMGGSFAGAPSQEYLLPAQVGIEGPNSDTWTEDADYSNGAMVGTSGGAAVSNITLRLASRIAVITGDTYLGTNSTSRDWAFILGIIKEITAGQIYTENRTVRASTLSRPALQQALTLAPRAAIQPQGRVSVATSYILDRKAPAIAQQKPLLQTIFVLIPRGQARATAFTQILIPIVLSRKAVASALSALTIQEVLALFPRAEGKAQVLPILQETLSLFPVSPATAQAKGIVGLSYLILPRALVGGNIPASLQQALSLSPRSRATVESEAALQQALALSPLARAKALALPRVGLLSIISPRAQAQTTAAMPPALALTLSAEALAEALIILYPYLAAITAPRALVEAFMAATVSVPIPPALFPQDLARAFASPVITPQVDILGPRIQRHEALIADLQQTIEELKAATAFKI